MKKIISGIIVLSVMLPMLVSASHLTESDCNALGKTLIASSDSCGVTSTYCASVGKVVIGDVCGTGGGSIPHNNAAWEGSPTHYDRIFGCTMMDISNTLWYIAYVAALNNGTWATFLSSGSHF